MNKSRILIADDDLALAKAMGVRLRHAGYDVTTVTDGYNALASAVHNKPDLLILDINMPAGSGFSVQERCRKVAPRDEIPVIYVTGDTSDETVEKARSLGAFVVIHKPIHFGALLGAIERALGNHAA